MLPEPKQEPKARVYCNHLFTYNTYNTYKTKHLCKGVSVVRWSREKAVIAAAPAVPAGSRKRPSLLAGSGNPGATLLWGVKVRKSPN